MSPRTMQYGNLRMTLPEGWSDGTQIVATGPAEQGFRSSLAVSSEPARPRETVTEYAARVAGMLSKVTEQFELVSERPATYGSVSGFMREYTHVARGVKLAQIQFYVLREGVVHTFTYTQRAERINVSRHVAERLFASVNLAPVSAPGASAAPVMRARARYVEPRFRRIIAA
ncbi:DcrB-related protein [Hyalangium rubrum]|uniref:DcrB-related protein n=1 Tax=Hyalangium rubrum TaxID=3103134 RepID=A0ABU5GUC4_9BACT|nr:DcrB-related protein [Hyalangium sp. s54d21]MDY7224783.1 DcrB-related protein [Hyalangium sp. s54d21]